MGDSPMSEGPSAPPPPAGPDGPPPPRFGQYAPGYRPEPPPPGGPGPAQWGRTPPVPPQYGQYGSYSQPPAPPGFGTGPWGRPAAPRPGIIPLRPLRLGELYDGAFRAIRTNPRVMFGLSAVVVTLTSLVSALVTWRYFREIESSLLSLGVTAEVTDADALLQDLLNLSGTVLGAQGVVSVVTTVLSGLLIVSVSRSVLGRTAGLAEVWAASRGLIGRLLVLSLLVLLIVAAPVAVWGAALFWLISAGAEGGAIAFGVLGFLAVLGAVAFLLTRTVLATPALMLERASISGALGRAWRLTRGTGWRVLGIYLLTSLLVGAVSNAVAGTAGVVLAFLEPEPSALITSPAYLIGTTVAQIVAAAITTPFMAAVVALLYIDVRMRTEGLDIELARASESAG